MKNLDIESTQDGSAKVENTGAQTPRVITKQRRITADKLFSLFTASIIKKRTPFTR